MILDSHTGLTFVFMREKDCYRLVTYFIKCVSVYLQQACGTFR